MKLMKSYKELLKEVQLTEARGEGKVFAVAISSTGSKFTSAMGGSGTAGAVGAMNSKGEFGFINDVDKTPYTPLGGRKTLVLVKDVLIFKPFDWGKDAIVKKGRAF